MNFKPKVLKSVVQQAIFNLIVFLIKEEYWFNYLEHALLLVEHYE